MRTSNVKLRAAYHPGVMHGDVLHAQEIVAFGHARGDGHLDLVIAPVGPLGPALGESRVVLEDLEPDVPVTLECLGGLALRRLRHVEHERPRMRDIAVDAKADRIARLDGHGLGTALAWLELVAPELLACHVVDRAMVVDAEVRGFANVATGTGQISARLLLARFMG